MENWDLSTKELDAMRAGLLERISMPELFGKYSRSVEPILSVSWTHKCICPNPAHKGGNERSPSCNFNEKTGRFYCFGCGFIGDAFDLMALMTGEPAEDIIQRSGKDENFDGYVGAPRVNPADLIRISQKLSITLRDYLKTFRGTACYDEETVWVEQIFRRIDERFNKLESAARGGGTDLVAARQLYEQVLMDLERRKTLRQECV